MIEFLPENAMDFETYNLDDPEVLKFLSLNENQISINKDFLEFFTI